MLFQGDKSLSPSFNQLLNLHFKPKICSKKLVQIAEVHLRLGLKTLRNHFIFDKPIQSTKDTEKLVQELRGAGTGSPSRWHSSLGTEPGAWPGPALAQALVGKVCTTQPPGQRLFGRNGTLVEGGGAEFFPGFLSS